jgi:hypothetical protein
MIYIEDVLWAHMLYDMLEFQRWGEKYVPPGVPESDDGKMAATKVTNVRVHVIETDSNLNA